MLPNKTSHKQNLIYILQVNSEFLKALDIRLKIAVKRNKDIKELIDGKVTTKKFKKTERWKPDFWCNRICFMFFKNPRLIHSKVIKQENVIYIIQISAKGNGWPMH